MGQKQSYSLNPDFDNKHAVQDEVAQTFMAAEPTPVSLRPVISVRSHTKIDQVVAKQVVESASCLDVEPSAPAQPMHLEKLEMEPELPHCILVLDKENADPRIEKEERKTVEHFAQPDGLLIREPELSELPGCTEPIKVSELNESIVLPFPTEIIIYEQLECGRYELEVQPLEIKPTVLLEESTDCSTSVSDIEQPQQIIAANPNIELYLSRTLEFNEI